MQLLLPQGWLLFCLALALVLITSLIMGMLSRRLYTDDVVIRKFDIMDLQLPASPREIPILINGIYKLPKEKSESVIKALKTHLYVDFIFMIGAYGAIFILCMQLSHRMPTAGRDLFVMTAWLQIVPLLCDIIENVYLLGKIKLYTGSLKDVKDGFFKTYRWLVAIKWAIALVATVGAISGVFYFWLSGQYSKSSLLWIGVVVGEIVLFVITARLIPKEKELH